MWDTNARRRAGVGLLVLLVPRDSTVCNSGILGGNDLDSIISSVQQELFIRLKMPG
jgi:hypothetical protein